MLIKDVELLDGKKIKIEISIYKIAQKLNLIWGGKAKQMIEELIKDIKDVAIYRKMDKRLESYQILDTANFGKLNLNPIINPSKDLHLLKHFITNIIFFFKIFYIFSKKQYL